MNKFLENYGHFVIAELYDKSESYTDDVEMIRELIKDKGKLNILECFCGTGRILIPLALDGHCITGIDLSTSMLERARTKIDKLDNEVIDRITLINDDIINVDWGIVYDLIIIGANAFYELPSSDMQAKCIEKSFKALNRDGLLFIDNNDYKGNWGQSRFYDERVSFEGKCENGYYGKLLLKHISFDEGSNILDYKRTLHIIDKDGNKSVLEYNGQKHPVTKVEVEEWLYKNNFSIIKLYGDRSGSTYTDKSSRAIFLAKKGK
ncbi:class I SAM-dependent methyltransferase [Mycoplasmatota bacterium WC44]